MKEIKPIINSILNDDLYKFSMQNAVIKKFPSAKVEYKFINRGKHKFPEGFGEELRKQVKYMEDLKLQKNEKDFLEANCTYFDNIYINYLSNYRYNSSEIGIIQSGNELDVSVSGFWHSTILWEVPVMAIISELYFLMTGQTADIRSEREKTNNNKAKLYGSNNIFYAEFGTRRRFSNDNQEEVIKDLKENYMFNRNFVGTSNVYFAMKYDLKVIGTHAHEWFMFHAAKYGYKMANHIAMENWIDVYRGDLGIALSDTFTTDVFLKTFDKKFAKLYDGVRHDSGEPIEFAKKIIDHYKKLGIDPMTKVIVFSDGVNPELAVKVKKYCIGKIMCSFGIGTNFSNDVGVKPKNIVIKMILAKPEDGEWVKCVKLSDDKGKNTGEPKEIEISQYTLNIN